MKHVKPYDSIPKDWIVVRDGVPVMYLKTAVPNVWSPYRAQALHVTKAEAAGFASLYDAEAVQQ